MLSLGAPPRSRHRDHVEGKPEPPVGDARKAAMTLLTDRLVRCTSAAIEK